MALHLVHTNILRVDVEDEARLFSGAQQQEKGQWVQTELQEFLS